MVVKKSGNTLTIENPTPYYNVIYALTDNYQKTLEKEINLKPFSTESLTTHVGNKFTMLLIDDYGGVLKMNYNCNGGVCSGTRVKK
ncbi:hypothetical protein MMG00_06295 [Ignatzschineria rhizosphaerae]|uniref:Pili assembly chaperone C-terminal domain-containing protein n=1 Tax=Ignatzschineria rhizosphaerae TaxID=2923279 RepID=A0ABY3X6D2_9GAMM|nr:hypothetical protein [Ignatzschineria rhizosphaerae]UNM97450.1 hypothetical protein MMG00_06295 [Ignatzschineria rhizosphaerae]